MSHMIGLPVIPFLHMLKHPINYGVALLILTIPFLIFGFDIIKSGIIYKSRKFIYQNNLSDIRFFYAITLLSPVFML